MKLRLLFLLTLLLNSMSSQASRSAPRSPIKAG